MNGLQRRWFGWLLAATAMVAMTTPARAQQKAQGRVQGVAFDSVGFRPLDSAFVQLAYIADPSVSRSTITDRQGRFVLDSLRSGAWLVSLMHPRIDSAGVTQLARRVDVGEKGNTRVEVTLPSARSIARRVCGDAASRDSSGFVHGRLTDASLRRQPVPGRVTFEWIDVVLTLGKGPGSVAYTRTPTGVEVESDSSGRFIACGVPSEGVVRVRGYAQNDSTGVVEMRIPSSGIGRVELAVGPSRVVSISPTEMLSRRGLDSTTGAMANDSTVSDSVVGPILARRGNGRLSGTVKTRDGAPIARALVTVPGTELAVRTDSSGTFRLRDLPVGTYTLEARALGFVASRSAVDIPLDGAADERLVLDRLASLDTVKVIAQGVRVYDQRFVGFERRRASGLGRYRGPEQLAAMRPFRVADILRTMAGIRIIYERGRDLVRMRTMLDYCTPEVFVDGMRMFTDDGDLDRLLYVEDVRAVEVYSPLIPTPPEFLVVGARCGVIVFLTGSRK